MSDNKDECIFLIRDTDVKNHKTKLHDFCNYIAVCNAYDDPAKILRFDEDDVNLRCINMLKFERCDRWRTNKK
jgi:hypothetical protein